MGCCVSTGNKPPPPPNNSNTKQAAISKSPPPSHEDEIVKEILSETPAAAVKPPIPTLRARNASSPFINSAPLLRDKEHQNGVVCKAPDDASEASEICSTLSESVSASTSLPEKRDLELRQRSPARLRNRGEIHRDKTVGRSPRRRFEPSPGRVRPVTGSGYGYGRRSGEISGGRSTSPVMRADSGLGRAPSARKTGKSPGRVGPGSADGIRKLDRDGKESGDGKCAANKESLENPLVSLECFIFL